MKRGPSFQDWLLLLVSALFTGLGLALAMVKREPGGFAVGGFFGACTVVAVWLIVGDSSTNRRRVSHHSNVLRAALPSVIQKLPTGALFQYAIADFKTPKGVLIEGRGVIPDVDVKPTRRTLLAGRDAQLDAAVEQILKR